MKDYKKLLFALLALLVLISIILLPRPGDITKNGEIVSLSSAGKASLAVLAMAVILWMTEAIPFPVTGLLAVVVLVMTKAVSFTEAVQDGFGNMHNRFGMYRREATGDREFVVSTHEKEK